MRTSSGATAVQVVWSSRQGREIEHLGSAHDEAELEALEAAAQQRIAAGQLELDLGLEPASGGLLPITSSRMGHLLDALERSYQVLGLEDAAGGDEVFRHLALPRIIEPARKLDSLRVPKEAGVAPAVIRDGQAPAFVPIQSMPGWLQAFASHQPVTYVIDTMRALALGGPVAANLWKTIAWLAGIFIVFVPLAVRAYRRAS